MSKKYVLFGPEMIPETEATAAIAAATEAAINVVQKDLQLGAGTVTRTKALFTVTDAPGITTTNVITVPFNGEKTVGEIGPVTNRLPDFGGLALRSWDAFNTNPIASAIIRKYIKWMLAAGLRIKTAPAVHALKTEGITLTSEQSEAFNDTVETRFEVWAASKHSSFSGENTFHEETETGCLNAMVGGDVLIVLRYVNNTVKVQAIDSMRLTTPIGYTPPATNTVVNGVEMDASGAHVKYFLRKGILETEEIPAYSATGIRTAYLWYGSKWRMHHRRGVPMIASVLEGLAKIDQYASAVLGSAVETQKATWQIVHDNTSDGTNPGEVIAANMGYAAVATDDNGEEIANRMTATTGKQTWNMGKGQEIKPVNKTEVVTGVKEFTDTMAGIMCAAVDIPPNVAFSLYTNSFSASRAATKDWDHTITVARAKAIAQHYGYVYKFWLYTEILKGKIEAEGYTDAVNSGNWMVTESYEQVGFTGPHFPHIDPLKEVQAERLKMGESMSNVPLTTVEQATENLGSGDSDSNLQQASEELKQAQDLGFSSPEPKVSVSEVI